MLRIREVISITGLSKSSIYNLIAACQFPRQVNLSTKSVAWQDSEVLNWMQERMDKRPGMGTTPLVSHSGVSF